MAQQATEQITIDAPQDRNVSNNPAVNLGGNTKGSTDTVFYTSDVNASISLPLMRGFGVAPNAQSIRIAFYESQAAQARTKLEVIRVLTDAEKTYWLLYAARRELEVRKKQYDLAVAQLERAKRQVQAGTLSLDGGGTSSTFAVAGLTVAPSQPAASGATVSTQRTYGLERIRLIG